MDNKSDLRLRAKSTRKNLDIEILSNVAIEKIRNLEVYKNAKNVLLFYPMNFEINVLKLLKDNKNFYLPRVKDENLLICPYEFGDELLKSCLNIQEPCSSPISPNLLNIAIVPALMADKNNYRLGYGGGFYDRFLAQNPHIKTILPIPKELIIEKLPVRKFDKKIDIVLAL